jgi:hypothetical protein
MILSALKVTWFFPKLQEQVEKQAQNLLVNKRLDHEINLKMSGMEIGLAGIISDRDEKQELQNALKAIHGVWGISINSEELLIECELPSAAFVLENKGAFWQVNGLVGSLSQKEKLSTEFKAIFPQVAFQNELVVQSGFRNIAFNLLDDIKDLMPRYSLQKIQFAKNRVHLTVHHSLAEKAEQSQELKRKYETTLLELDCKELCFPEFVIEPKGLVEVDLSATLNGIMDLPFLVDLVAQAFPQAKIKVAIKYVPEVGSVGSWELKLRRLKDILRNEFGVLKVIGTEDGRVLLEAEVKTSDQKDELIRAARIAFGHTSVVRAKVLKTE